jgi:hypothetical protein
MRYELDPSSCVYRAPYRPRNGPSRVRHGAAREVEGHGSEQPVVRRIADPTSLTAALPGKNIVP